MNWGDIMTANTSKDAKVFGMTQEEIFSLADALVEQKDTNHPANSSSYTDFIKTAKAGKEQLKKGNYCKIQK